MPSKQAQILDLLEKTDLSNAEIAEVVGCLPAYVRVVQQRLLNGGETKAHQKWRDENRPKYLAAHRQSQKRYWSKKQCAAIGARA